MTDHSHDTPDDDSAEKPHASKESMRDATGSEQPTPPADDDR
jgi:hypothetical protein